MINLLNHEILNNNTEHIYILYCKIKKLWDKLDIDIEMLELHDKKHIMKHVTRFTDDSIILTKFIKHSKIVYFNYNNLDFYYLYNNDNIYTRDIFKIKLLIKQTIIMIQYFNIIHRVKIIWIPIDKKRDFKHDIITDKKLLESAKQFNAFCTSGITFHERHEPCNISIVARYEEIHKLLFHELLHNFNIDGHEYHSELTEQLQAYTEIKQNNYHYIYSMYESYTELISSYLNIIFLLIHKNINKNIKKNIKKNIITEFFYSMNIIVNLAKLNNYHSFNEFLVTKTFKGDICFYEYYLVKGLLYNYLTIDLINNNIPFFKNLYDNIIHICKNYINNKILEHFFKIYFKSSNFKYCFLDF